MPRLVLRLLPAALLALTVSPLSAQTTLPNIAAFNTTAVAEHSNMCLTVPGAVATPDTQLQQTACSPGPAQSWRFEPVTGQTQSVTIRTSNSLCLAARAGGTANDTAVVQMACTGGAEQQFRLEALSASDRFRLRHLGSGRCVDVRNSATTAGTLIRLWDCQTPTSGQSPTSGRNQNWTLSGAANAGLVTSLPVPANQAEASRFLQQATYGATLPEISRVTSLGYLGWINDQFTRPATLHLELHQAIHAEFSPHYSALETATNAQDVARYVFCEESSACKATRIDAWTQIAVYGDDQLRQRVAFALSQFFVISDTNARVAYSQLAVSDYYDTLAVNAFGNYRTLLEDVTLHPLMGRFLGMLRNAKADPSRNSEPDENFAREVMQLFSIGLVELNVDGTPRLDANGNTIPTYDNETIRNTARALTGWTFGGATSWSASETTVRLPGLIRNMEPWSVYHDTSVKTLLGGTTTEANATAAADLKLALDSLANHPNVGPFLGRHLIQRLVTSNPSPAYVGRVAAVFNNNGSGVRGDMRAVIRQILMDPEARDMAIANRDEYGKVKEPMLRLTAVWRAFNAQGTSATRPLLGLTPTRAVLRDSSAATTMRQTVMSAPSVFNFYRPNFSPSGELRNRDLVAPEMQLIDEASALSTYNLLHDRLYTTDAGDTTIPTTATDPLFSLGRIRLNLTAEKALAVSPGALADRLNLLLLAGRMTPALRRILVDAAYATPMNDGGGDRVEDMIFLIASSPQFAAQR